MSRADYPNITSSDREGYWTPDEGFEFEPGRLSVVDNGLVDIALGASSITYKFDEFKSELEQITGMNQSSRVKAALEILATKCVIINPEQASAYQRKVFADQAKAELKSLVKQAIQISVDLILEDIKKLKPYSWDPFSQRKLKILRDTELLMRSLRAKTTSDVALDDMLEDLRSGRGRSTLVYTPGSAISELMLIHNERRWER